MNGRQLALPFPHAPHYDHSEILRAPCNDAALAWLDRTTEWPGLRLAVWGGEGAGKTHLAHAWARRQGGVLTEGYLLRGVPRPEAPVAVDDADALADEAALLHLLNAAAEMRLPVLLLAREPPARWKLSLPDLASRVRAMVAVGIQEPDDAMLRALLDRLLADRQLDLAEGLRDWLLARLPRTPGALREAASRLDRASLSAGGRVTRALAGEVLVAMEA